jgi:hypothetical protein
MAPAAETVILADMAMAAMVQPVAKLLAQAQAV